MPSPTRRWGQHWLASASIAERLVEQIGPRPDDRFVEIGPGRGALTLALLARDATVAAVEIDPECCVRLAHLNQPRLTVTQADVLTVDPAALGLQPPLRIAGNLPYYIGSPILRWTDKYHDLVADGHYLLPADVVRRITAPPGGRDYGFLSVLVRWSFEPSVLMTLPPSAFRPRPKIDSALMRLMPVAPSVEILNTAETAEERENALQVVAAAFSQRRKKVANALGRAGWSRDAVEEACEQAGIDPNDRAERISPETFKRLAQGLAQKSKSGAADPATEQPEIMATEPQSAHEKSAHVDVSRATTLGRS